MIAQGSHYLFLLPLSLFCCQIVVLFFCFIFFSFFQFFSCFFILFFVWPGRGSAAGSDVDRGGNTRTHSVFGERTWTRGSGVVWCAVVFLSGGVGCWCWALGQSVARGRRWVVAYGVKEKRQRQTERQRR